ncbi:hypothetical protein BDW02DRAFT_494737 [Decorospora gaudefroyi]|uniref:Uncharacterized protein n=1 Tax=Decorospora gaudefroyi TaxID=184978 RepID=A0A6A5KQT0_9PLEO|nr:hypothetical protein BDW02DRAFT_494737 [Decorospora gaudefroyi]
MRLQETNWNARRERSRIHHEQSTRGATTYRRQNLSHKPQDGSYPALPRKTSKPSSSSNIRTYSSHHQLLANSRSMSGFSSSSSSNGTLDRRSSLGAMSGHGHTDARAGDAESSGRASTDSSSFHSTQDGAVQRSRSGSSVHSTFASQIVPPLPVASPPPMQRYRTDTFSYPDINRAIGPGRPTRPSSTTRTTSLPTIRIERVAATGHENRHSMSRSPQHKHQHHQTDIQKARLESLAALTAAHPTTSSSQRRHQTYRPLSHSHLKPPPQYSALSPSHNTKTPHTSTDLQPSIHEKRPLPNRESLTQWKAERDQDVAGTTRKAHIKERVRRANELELEREQELVKVGKGTGKERERGCFAGILGVFGLRAR